MDGTSRSVAESTVPPPSRDTIIALNVGGRRFVTSHQTLTWIPDSFFSSLLSGRIPSLKDESGAIFIDRDSDAFVPILNYLRTKNVDFRNVDLKTLKHEAEFFGVLPLVKRLTVCEELERSNCGGLLFYCQLHPPVFEQVSHSDTPSQPQFPYGLRTDLSHQVLQLTCHGNCIAAAYNHCICVLSVRESRGWEMVFTTPPLERVPQRIALNTRSIGGGGGGGTHGGPILAAVLGNEIKVWSCSPSPRMLASFDMKIPVEGLFFVGTHLVAISNTGKVAVWQSVQQHWQLQDLAAPVCSYDMAGSFLLLGCSNGNIYYIDMEKFPVRMKDNDLLVTQLFEDPFKEPITALSVYITPNVFPGSMQNWMEVAYGTKEGSVRVVVRHPENIGQAPQIFQSYNVHTCPILRVVLGEKHLISVCAENHVRTWTVTRFRGRISTQPGSNPIASFKVLSLEGAHSLFYPINSIGPFGERDEEQVFIQRIIPETDKIFVRLCSTGKRVCEVNSVDGSNISSYCVHECEGASRIGMRSRRFIFTGHVNGSVQVWDLTTALELSSQRNPSAVPDITEGGPTTRELLDLLQNCDVSASRASSRVSSRAPSPSPSLMSIVFPGLKAHSSHPGTPINTPAIGRSSSNLFQPIHSSTSNPSLNCVSNVLIQSPLLAVPIPENATCKLGPILPKIHCRDASSQTDLESQEADSEAQVAGSSSRQQSPGQDKEECPLCAKSGNVHQRSRSNEIDYSSSGLANRVGLTAFRSPPGSVKAFRPVSIDSTHSSVCSGLSDPSALSSRPSSGMSMSSEATLVPTDSHRPSQASPEAGRSPPPWTKELDASIFDYFDSNDSHIQVTDC